MRLLLHNGISRESNETIVPQPYLRNVCAEPLTSGPNHCNTALAKMNVGVMT